VLESAARDRRRLLSTAPAPASSAADESTGKDDDENDDNDSDKESPVQASATVVKQQRLSKVRLARFLFPVVFRKDIQYILRTLHASQLILTCVMFSPHAS